MKKEINFLKVVILVLIIAIGGTACMAKPEEIESSHSSTSSSHLSQTSSPAKATEPTTYSDKQILEAVYSDYYGSKLYKYSKKGSADHADRTMSRAEKLPDRYLGSVTSEEDAKKKIEAVWSEIDKGMLESIKKIFESGKQSYIDAVFYEKYDVWFARTPISGITEDGRSFGLTGGFEIVIRKSDGKILAIEY